MKMFDDYNYMRALWDRFYERSVEDKSSNRLHITLSERLGPEDRKLLLRLVDSKKFYTEMISLESFIAGFRLAGGICMELADEHYDYDIEGETVIRRGSDSGQSKSVSFTYENEHLIELPGGILFDDSPEALLAELIDDGWTGSALYAEFIRRHYLDLPEFRSKKN